MIPPIIRQRLGQLRRRERVVRLAWGLARVFAAVIAVILFACLVDWMWDRVEDTPAALRTAMLVVTAVVAALAVILWILVPIARRLPDDLLALWVEERAPKLRHRLISAVQLNRPDADLAGMSTE